MSNHITHETPDQQLAVLTRIAVALQTIARANRIEPPPAPSVADPAVIDDGHSPSGDATVGQPQPVAGGDDVRQELAEIKKLLKRKALSDDSSKRFFFLNR